MPFISTTNQPITHPTNWLAASSTGLNWLAAEVEGLTSISHLACVRQHCAIKHQESQESRGTIAVSGDVVTVFLLPPSEDKVPVGCQLLLNKGRTSWLDLPAFSVKSSNLQSLLPSRLRLFHIPPSFTHACTDMLAKATNIGKR